MNYIKETLEYLTRFFQWWVIVQPWERAVRTRFGKKAITLTPGTHFRIPFFDIIYIQTIRLRVVSMPLQTVTTKDGQTVTIASAVGYSICDIEKLYNSLFHPESTICNIVLSEISEYVYTHSLQECSPKSIEALIIDKLNSENYGIKYQYIKIVGYAVVKTYRLIQDSHWTPNDLSMIQPVQ